jgi:maltooligosyltrehalose trehalohydrolase
MVLLDVVYNHFGPEGCICRRFRLLFYGPLQNAVGRRDQCGWRKLRTSPRVLIHNALYWIEEFRLDGLRLDAVHAIVDASPIHMLEELRERVRRVVPDRQVHLVLENEENHASRLTRDTAGEPRWYTAQWNDDVHHALHVTATGEASGYYADYLDQGERLGRALAEGFAFQGEIMPYRGTARGEPSAGLPPTAFVAFAQNHDQIGNRAFGDRLSAIAAPKRCAPSARSTCCCRKFQCCSWARSGPRHSLFFFSAILVRKLAEAVKAPGRRDEFARFPNNRRKSARHSRPDRRGDFPLPPSLAGRISTANRTPLGSNGIDAFSQCAIARSCRGWMKLMLAECTAARQGCGRSTVAAGGRC